MDLILVFLLSTLTLASTSAERESIDSPPVEVPSETINPTIEPPRSACRYAFDSVLYRDLTAPYVE